MLGQKVGASNCHGVNSGWILVGVVSAPDPGWTSEQWVSASGLVPSIPGWKQIQRLNWERYSDQCACQHVSFFVDVKSSRFCGQLLCQSDVVSPSLVAVENHQQFLIVGVIVLFCVMEGLIVEGDQVDL